MNTIQIKHSSNFTPSTTLDEAISKVKGLNLLQGEPAIATYGSDKKQVLAIGSETLNNPSLFYEVGENDNNYVINGQNSENVNIMTTQIDIITSGDGIVLNDTDGGAITIRGGEIVLNPDGDVFIAAENKAYYGNIAIPSNEIAKKGDLGGYVVNGVNPSAVSISPTNGEIYIGKTDKTSFPSIGTGIQILDTDEIMISSSDVLTNKLNQLAIHRDGVGIIGTDINLMSLNTMKLSASGDRPQQSGEISFPTLTIEGSDSLTLKNATNGINITSTFGAIDIIAEQSSILIRSSDYMDIKTDKEMVIGSPIIKFEGTPSVPNSANIGYVFVETNDEYGILKKMTKDEFRAWLGI